MVPLARQMPYLAPCKSAKRCANSPAYLLGTGKPPQWRLSTTLVIRSTSEDLNCGQGENGFVRTGSPPRMANLDIKKSPSVYCSVRGIECDFTSSLSIGANWSGFVNHDVL